MSEMVERVARAMCAIEHQGSLVIWGQEGPKILEYWRESARAAIEAMREPTLEMIKAGNSRSLLRGGYEPDVTWHIMVDEALR